MKKLSALILSASLLIPAVSGTAQAADDSGYKFTVTSEDGCVTIRGASGHGETLNIPETINGMPVAAIADFMFAGSTELTSITLPDSIKTIGKKAFSNCAKLTNVYIGSSAETIDEQAFYACPKLQRISISTDNKTYHSENGSLYKGDSLLIYAGSNNAVISDTTASIGNYAFFGRTELSSVTIPESVKSIGDYAFSGCLGLKSIIIPDSVTTVGTHCFLSCTELAAVKLGDSLRAIPNSCFHSCTSLKNVHIPDSVTDIDTHAFYSCDSLSALYIPSAVSTIVTDAVGRKYSIRTDKDENISTLTIYSEANSAAEKYASYMGLSFKAGTAFTSGDINADSIIDGKDASMALTEYALISSGKSGKFTDIQTLSADFNYDSIVDGKDASAILSYYAFTSVSQ